MITNIKSQKNLICKVVEAFKRLEQANKTNLSDCIISLMSCNKIFVNSFLRQQNKKMI